LKRSADLASRRVIGQRRRRAAHGRQTVDTATIAAPAAILSLPSTAQNTERGEPSLTADGRVGHACNGEQIDP